MIEELAPLAGGRYGDRDGFRTGCWLEARLCFRHDTVASLTILNTSINPRCERLLCRHTGRCAWNASPQTFEVKQPALDKTEASIAFCEKVLLGLYSCCVCVFP